MLKRIKETFFLSPYFNFSILLAGIVDRCNTVNKSKTLLNFRSKFLVALEKQYTARSGIYSKEIALVPTSSTLLLNWTRKKNKNLSTSSQIYAQLLENFIQKRIFTSLISYENYPFIGSTSNLLLPNFLHWGCVWFIGFCFPEFLLSSNTACQYRYTLKTHVTLVFAL